MVYFSVSLFGQSAGDYGTVGSGGWGNDGSNWLVFVSSADWSDATPAPGAPTATTNVWIRSGHTDSMFVSNVACNNLNIAGTLEFSKTLTTAMQVNGNINIVSTGTFKTQVNTLGITGSGGLANTLNLQGDLINNGSSFIFRNGSAGSTLSVCNLTLSGTTNSTLTTNSTYTAGSNAGMLNAVTINKTGGAKVVLGSNIVMNGGSTTGPAVCNVTLTFVSGLIETGANIWIILNTTGANVAGYSSTSYINGAMGRGMSSGAGSKDFPVGDANGYRLFNIHETNGGGSGAGHYAIVRCIHGHANTGSSSLDPLIDKVSEVRYYQVGYNNSISGNSSMNFDVFRVSYGIDDGVFAGNTALRVAYSTDTLKTWKMITQTIPQTTVIKGFDTSTVISPDTLKPGISINAGSVFYVSLADSAGGANSLPVELTSFTGMRTNGGVILNWSTANELNNNGYDVEKRISGKTSTWETIGFVKGSGNSNSIRNYSFTDKESFMTGKYEYRLKQNDVNGTSTYSKIVEVDIAQPTAYSINQNYPNPFNPSTVIEYSLPKAGNVELIVFNSIGQEVSRLINGYQESGNYSITFNSKNLTTGVYFYQLKTTNYTNIKKMILIK
jgi:hypothetical protein